MCFSAPVSITASGLLTAIGLVTIRKVQARRELPFAIIPIGFAVQQFTEGLIWLTLPKPDMGWAAYALIQLYAAFVGIIWPILVPLSVYCLETDALRKRITQLVFTAGAIVAAFSLYVLVRYGVTAEIVKECIVYTFPGDDWSAALPFYLVATCMAGFLSSHRSVRWIGLANVAGFFAAYYFYRINFASVWCFFAAMISSLIYLHFNYGRRAEVAAGSVLPASK